MEAFLSILVTLGVVAIIVFFISRKYRDAFLDKIVLLPGEKIVFEEACKKLEASIGAKIKLRIFPNSFVRVTNYRIIIAQKVLGSQRMALKYVFNFKENKEEIEPFRGYTAMKIKKDATHLVDDKGEVKVEIVPTTGAGSLVPYWVRITPSDLGTYRKALDL